MGLPRTEWIGGGGGVLLSVSSNSYEARKTGATRSVVC